MIFHIAEYVRNGFVDNRKQGVVTLGLNLMGVPFPFVFQLQGNCLQDLVGCRLEFENPKPIPFPEELPTPTPCLPGVVGDMTASRRVMSMDKTVANSLYLEWFIEGEKMLLLESSNFTLKLTDSVNEVSCEEEQVQIMANQQSLRSHVRSWIKHYAVTTEDENLPDYRWDTRLREAEAISMAYQVVFQKYKNSPRGDIRTAFVMGWDHALEEIARSEESGISYSCRTSGTLNLFDILNEQEKEEVADCLQHPLLRQVTELTDWCHFVFKDEIKKIRHNQELPQSPLCQIFSCLRYVAPRILSCLLQEKDNNADFRTLSARMNLCEQEIRVTLDDINKAGNRLTPEVTERFLNLLEELIFFRDALSHQIREND